MVEITLFEPSAKELAMNQKQHTITFPSPIKVHPEISEEDYDADEAAAIIVRELEAMDNIPLDAATSISSPVTSVPDTSVLVTSDPAMSIPVTSVPGASDPATPVPVLSVMATSVPAASVPDNLFLLFLLL